MQCKPIYFAHRNRPAVVKLKNLHMKVNRACAEDVQSEKGMHSPQPIN